MKTKCIVFISFFLFTCTVYGTNNGIKEISSNQSLTKTYSGDDNELKINLLMSVIGIPEISYERFFDDNSGLGLSLSFSAMDKNDANFEYTILPYYRIYFGKKKCSGFFIEANMAVLNYNDVVYPFYDDAISFNSNYTLNQYVKSKWVMGMGCAVGLKFLTSNNFIGEAYLGLGRVFDKNIDIPYPRVGITLGKRF